MQNNSRSIASDVEDPSAATARHLRLLKLLRLGNAREIGSILLSRKLDFDAWGRDLIEGRMGVYVYSRMQELNLLALLPRTLSNQLRDQYVQQQGRNTALLALLAEVDHLFKEAGTDFVLLKGFPVAERFWGSLERRFSMDLDLLVERRKLQPAVATLTAAGFAKPSLTPAAQTIALRLSHALEMTRGALSLDLHWTLRNRPGMRFDLDRIWARRKPYRIGGVACQVLSDQDQLLILLVGLANDLECGHQRFRSLWDIYLLLQGLPGFEWQDFLAERDAEGVTLLVVNILTLILYRLDCREEFPELAAVLEVHTDALLVHSSENADTVLSRPSQSLAGRRWSARLLPIPAWHYWLWWTTTLPLRFLLGRQI